MDPNLFAREFDKVVMPKAKKPRFRIGNLDRAMSRHPLPTGFDEPQEEDEAWLKFRSELMKKFRQMMYVSGETAEPSQETTGMVEEIVRQQVIEMVSDYPIYSTRSVALCTISKVSFPRY